MSTACCHGAGTVRPTIARRCASAAGWVVPASVLAVMPKCPMCVAAYIAAGTGLGLSFTTAAYVRTSAIVWSVGVLVWLSGRAVCRVVSNARRTR